MRKPRIIAIAAQKGGTSKSTTSWPTNSTISTYSSKALSV